MDRRRESESDRCVKEVEKRQEPFSRSKSNLMDDLTCFLGCNRRDFLSPLIAKVVARKGDRWPVGAAPAPLEIERKKGERGL